MFILRSVRKFQIDKQIFVDEIFGIHVRIIRTGTTSTVGWLSLLHVCRLSNWTPCTQITQLYRSTTALYLTVDASRNTEHILLLSHRTNEFLNAVAKSDYQPSKVRPSTQITAIPTWRIFMKLRMWDFYWTLSTNPDLGYNRTKIADIFRTDLCKWNTWQMAMFMWNTWSVAMFMWNTRNYMASPGHPVA